MCAWIWSWVPNEEEEEEEENQKNHHTCVGSENVAIVVIIIYGLRPSRAYLEDSAQRRSGFLERVPLRDVVSWPREIVMFQSHGLDRVHRFP